MKALEIDPDLAEAHATLGLIHENLWEWAAAEREFKRAIELKPNYATAHHWYSIYLQRKHRYDDALIEIKKAQALDPLSLIINTNVGYDLSLVGRKKDAIDQLHRTIELDPTFGWAHLWLGRLPDHLHARGHQSRRGMRIGMAIDAGVALMEAFYGVGQAQLVQSAWQWHIHVE